MYKVQPWELVDLLPAVGTPEIETFIDNVKDRLVTFCNLRELLSTDISINDFLKILKLYEKLYSDTSSLIAYSTLWFSEDTGNQEALSFRARIQTLAADITNNTLFFELWWKNLEQDTAEHLIAQSGDIYYYLENLRRYKPYTLSEAEERIINIKDVNGIKAVLTVYDLITSAYKFHLNVDDEERTLTRGQLMSYASNPSATLRAAAYKELYRVYGEDTDVLSAIYAARIRDWSEEQIKLRGFESPISVRNLQNDIPDPVVDTLLSVIRQNAPLFQRFFRFKAGVLGIEKLRRYDLYAPLSETEKTYTFNEAVKIVDESYRAFSPELANKALLVISQHHLDAEIRSRKMDGAYCYGPLPKLTPWVLMNFTGKVRDVSTLAHELGHAVHAMMAENHSPLTFHASLPMAETASVFGEMLLTDKLLAEENDPLVQRTLISTFLDDAYATITRQGYFVLFEQAAHRMILEGATPDQLHNVYMDNLREQFGDTLDISEDFKLEWTVIPHIYDRPFYCYAYAFGNLLVLALYRKYKEIGQSFKTDYLHILSYGGSASPEYIIREAGFNMASPAFWQGGFNLLSEMLVQLETLT
jgi:oligoendopeptidase F